MAMSFAWVSGIRSTALSLPGSTSRASVAPDWAHWPTSSGSSWRIPCAPASTFIEQNLTNWTLTTGQVRFNIKVGVAYGSSVRAVTDALEDVAARHGQVLKDPKPEILFEDFGSDALIFSLYYWLDISKGVVARQVASDLRNMIEDSFTDHGLVIAFPQRDVHLDTVRPLAVQLVGGPTPEPPPRPAETRPGNGEGTPATNPQ